MTMPLIIHDLQNSQMFALAQAAGRAGIAVEGTVWGDAPWVNASRYVRRAVPINCLSEQMAGMYAAQLKQAGLQGVWLPCMDDMAAFTSEYAPFLEKIGMRFLTVHKELYEQVTSTQLSDTSGLKVAAIAIVPAQELIDRAAEQDYPLMVKSRRDMFCRFDTPESLIEFLMQVPEGHRQQTQVRIQRYIEGETDRMATAMILLDGDSRPVRGFTGRRLAVASTQFGPFGETTAAVAEWIPELYEGAAGLLSAIGWKGFAEVECKQGADGQWYVMEINPRLSGWSSLAEADGAGLLQAYYRLCSEDVRLHEACLQRSAASYRRIIATSFHQPDWARDVPENRGALRRVRQICSAFRDYRRAPDKVLLGAWDRRDGAASRAIFMETLKKKW